ncbi:MAG: sigma-70 family RNA polymerase sigma factor, partial [Gammaproteobacteria bacterium]
NRAPTYDPSKAAVSTWIYTIARNYRIDVLRKKQLSMSDEEKLPESGYQQNMDEELNLDRGGNELKQAIANLNEEQRMVIQKVYFEDKSHQIAAEELEMTLGVVKSRIRSALKIMKKQIGDDWL